MLTSQLLIGLTFISLLEYCSNLSWTKLPLFHSGYDLKLDLNCTRFEGVDTGIRSGTYTLEIKKDGYQPIKATVQIKRGQKVQLKLQLVS